MAAYSFLTTWCVSAPIQPVWDVICASDRWPEWWKGVRNASSSIAHASGELKGIGIWRLYEGAAGTAVIYSWDVSTTRRWMNRLGPLARPAFGWTRDYVMRNGAHGPAKELGAELVAFD